MSKAENDLMAVWKFLKDHADELNGFSKGGIQSLICMTMEEWNKAHGTDVVEFVDEIANVVKSVNADLGKY